jgi:hypothetical protein
MHVLKTQVACVPMSEIWLTSGIEECIIMSNMRIVQNISRNTFVLLCSVVAAVGIGAGVSFGRLLAKPSSDTNAALLNPLPETIEELVASAELVVVGTVGDITYKGMFYGYDEGIAIKSEKGKGKHVPAGIPIVDFEIQVEQAILDDGTVSGGQPLILREAGDLAIQSHLSHPAMPKTGDRRLFFLSRNPDGTYGKKSLMHQIDISGPVAVYFTGHSAEAPFGQDVLPLDFVGRVEKIADRIKHN